MSDMREALHKAIESKAESTETKNTEIQDPQTLEENNGDAADKQIENTEGKQTGIQKRINKLTAKNKQSEERTSVLESRLADALKEINDLKAVPAEKTEVPEPDFEDMGAKQFEQHLMDKVAELIKSSVSNELSSTSKELLENQNKKRSEEVSLEFQDKLLKAYEDKFEDGDFVGSEEDKELLFQANELFNSNPGFYKSKVDKFGAEYVVDIIQDKATKNKEKVEEIMGKAEKAKGLKGGSENVTELEFQKGISMQDALKQAMLKLKK